MKSSRLQGENTGFETQVDSLSTLKYDLLDNIDSLQTAYQLIIAKNDSLNVSLEDALQNVASQNEQLKNIRRQGANSQKGLLQEINQLRALKAELEGNIGKLIEENESLREENSALTEEVASTEKRNQELSTKSSQLESANLIAPIGSEPIARNKRSRFRLFGRFTNAQLKNNGKIRACAQPEH